MYKLIVSDMDGTLLNSTGEIPEENARAVKKAVDSGVEFAIVTGRPYISVKAILKRNKIKCSVIGCNGAQVTDENGRTVQTHYISRERLVKVLKSAEEKDIYYHLYDDRYIYTKSRIELLKVLKNYSKKAIKKQFTFRRIFRGIKRLFFAEVKVVGNLFQYATTRERGFYKVQIASMNQEVLKKVREELTEVPDIDITSSAYYNLEIGPKGVTKGTALKELAEVKNIRREEIIALGDNFNDIPMLEYAGKSVAMENAEPEVKAKANYHTKSNDDNGVAYAIEELVFKNRKM